MPRRRKGFAVIRLIAQRFLDFLASGCESDSRGLLAPGRTRGDRFAPGAWKNKAGIAVAGRAHGSQGAIQASRIALAKRKIEPFVGESRRSRLVFGHDCVDRGMERTLDQRVDAGQFRPGSLAGRRR